MAPRKNAIFDSRLTVPTVYKYVHCIMYIVHRVQYLDLVSWPRVSLHQYVKKAAYTAKPEEVFTDELLHRKLSLLL
jgi:hypothetical protein